MALDSDWFKNKIAESQYGTMRQLVKRMKNRQGKRMGVAALSLMLSGERTIGLEDARQLADLLEVPMSEIIQRAGIRFGRRDNLP
jgi:hypothetical protein